MELDTSLQYRTFLEELHDLAHFRNSYALDNPSAGLEDDDPDVKRIIEALAFFNARTQIALTRSIDAANKRLYRQFFSYLLTPLPAMAVMSATPTGTLTEVLDLPIGTEFGLQPDKGGLVMFRTTQPLRILPMAIESVKEELLPGSGCRLLLNFKANFQLNEHPEALDLHINYLNDLKLSLKVFQFLRNSLKSAYVQYGTFGPEQPLISCEFTVGARPADISQDDWDHPMERERQYFHFPEQALYLHVNLPVPPRNWKSFTLVLDCVKPWPRQIRLNREIFHLFTVPVANNQRAMAQPILCDGTLERYTIRHPEPQLGFCLQKVMGVYEVGEQGTSPLRPGVLAGGNGSYEIEQGPSQEGGGHLYWLIPHFPAAFEQPRTIVIDAIWQQPWFDQITQNPFSLQIFRRQVQGVQWGLLDTARPHDENLQLNEVNRYIHLLTLMHKTSFNVADLKELLLAMGSVASSRFQAVFNSLVEVRFEEEPIQGNNTKQIYCLLFKPLLEDIGELIEPFVNHVGGVLDIWFSEDEVVTTWEMLDDPGNLLSGGIQ